MTSPFVHEQLVRASLEKRVRDYMRDYPELNTLTDGQENSSAQIQGAIDGMVERVNTMAPPIGYVSVERMPLDMAIDWCVAWLLDSAAILMIRNDLQFTAGGMTVQVDQHNLYRHMAAERRQRFEMAAKEWKASQNMQQAVDSIGGVYSDWSVINSRRYWNDAFYA